MGAMVALLRRSKDLQDLLTDRAFWEKWRDRMMPIVAEIQAAAWRQGVEAGLSIAPTRFKQDERLNLSAEEIAAASERVLLTYSDEWWRQFAFTTQTAIRAAILRASVEGVGIEAVIADIEPLFGPARAKVIATTETTRLYGLGAQATYAAAGLPGWSWQTVQDFAVCPICAPLQGSEYDIGVPFNPAHPNCRCFPRPIVPGE